MSLENILVFATGCDEVPICGFERQPKLEFIHTGVLPTASTCGPTLRLPTANGETAAFSENMRLAVLECFGFVQV